MKNLLVLLLLGFVGTGRAQTVPAKSEASPAGAVAFFSSPGLALPRLYDAAIKHSAEIARLDAAKGVASEDVVLARKKMLNMFSLASSYNYGSLPYFATADASTRPAYIVNPFSQGLRAVYSVGVNAVVPLDVLSGRRSTVRRQELILNEAEAERSGMESKIRQYVITQYQGLVLARVEMQHYQDALQSAGINKKIADKKFKEGEIQVDEQITAIDFYNRAVLADAEAKSKYQTAVLLMEDLIGMSINTLMQGQ
ncbi:TolC family protein [Hymenobacter terricola]|uniref:TolC family protein n=1 Tax=Hymenobacter terricola TaxID=2819236 RepID=UPI001B3182B2|nr:TolC family protein [Hymenobacter terricola]